MIFDDECCVFRVSSSVLPGCVGLVSIFARDDEDIVTGISPEFVTMGEDGDENLKQHADDNDAERAFHGGVGDLGHLRAVHDEGKHVAER